MPTPVSNSTILLAEIATGKSYWDGGLTLKKMGLEGLDVAGVKKLLEQGYQ